MLLYTLFTLDEESESEAELDLKEKQKGSENQRKQRVRIYSSDESDESDSDKAESEGTCLASIVRKRLGFRLEKRLKTCSLLGHLIWFYLLHFFR